MGFFDDVFGGMFDFNGDGKTDFFESALGYKILEDIMEEEKAEERAKCDDIGLCDFSNSSFDDELDCLDDDDFV